jgi:hypothetical protein
MPQDLGQIAAATAEYEEIGAVGIAAASHHRLPRKSYEIGLDDRFHETGLDEASIHGTGIMFVDSSFEKS